MEARAAAFALFDDDDALMNAPVAVRIDLDLEEDDGDEGQGIRRQQLRGDALDAQQGRTVEHVSPLLFDKIRSNPTCASVLSGWGNEDNSCLSVVEHCNANPDQAFYTFLQTGKTPLHEACLRNVCSHVVRSLLQANPRAAVEKDGAGNTPLHLLFADFSYRSVNPGEVDDIVGALLQVNPAAVASALNGDRNTALHTACSAPEAMIQPSTLDQLLAANPDCASVLNNRNQTPLSLYCKQRHASPALAQIVFQANPNAIHTLDLGGWSPMHDAANTSNTELIRFLVQQAPEAASIRTTPHGRTALHLLCLHNPREEQLPAIEALLQAGPQAVTIPDHPQKQTPLHMVCKHSRVLLNAVRLLANSREVAAMTDSEHYTPLHHACENGADDAVIEHLLSVHSGAATIVTRKQDTALHVACGANSSVGTVRLLIKANPDALTMKNDYGFTPLHCVCRAYQPRMGIVQALLEACPSAVSLRTNGGETPVHLACSSGAFVGVLQLLTRAQTSVSGERTSVRDLNVAEEKSMMNKIGNTPLHEACFRTLSHENIETLARAKPEWINIRNNAGYTPLQILCKGGGLDERIVTTFARLCGPEVFSVVDSSGHTPLHSASREGSTVDAIRSLTRAFPDALIEKTTYGDTPLHLATLRGANVDVVKHLAEASSYGPHSPLKSANTAGQTPIGIAIEQYQKMCRGVSCCVTTTSGDQMRAFDVLAALVKIMFYGAGFHETETNRASLVRACVSLHRQDVRLDPAFIRRAIHVHPEEVRMMDSEGNYPLHIEASIPIEKMALLDADVNGCCSGMCHKRAGVLSMLLEAFPDAVRVRNSSGSFPLGLMMLSGRSWNYSFALALRNFPPALHWSRGMDDSLLALTLATVSKECGIDTLYNFILSRPEVVRRRR